ncbi:hypothetical protein OH77DRAFT_947745 [Trametes cingulata]|nr:hypothetical protein OH77DRAFT_947745 [Trametes cingulata]
MSRIIVLNVKRWHSQKSKAQHPYERNQRSRVHRTLATSDKAPSSSALPVPPSTSFGPAVAGPSAAPTGTGRAPLRDACLEFIRENYPDFRSRNDFDVLTLGTTPKRTGTQDELYAWLDERYAQHLPWEPHPEQGAKRTLDTLVEITGKKPRPGTKFVYTRPIPDSTYSVRLFPGALGTAEYCMDFVETATGQPVNQPFEFELWNIPNPETPWLTMPAVGQLRSIEHVFGIKGDAVLPGEEKFILRDGQTCLLTRPGKRPVWFTVPIRPPPVPEALQYMDKLDFPKLAVEE